MATRPSWSTAIPRRSRPTTTPPIGSTSSRSRSRTCSRSSRSEKPDGVIVQFGGQTPLKLSRALEDAGAPDHRHHARVHRRRRGPRALPAARAQAQAQTAGQCHGAHRGAGRAARARSGLSARRAAVLRARRARDGSGLHRRGPAQLHDAPRCASRTTARCCSIASSTWRSRWTSMPSATARTC